MIPVSASWTFRIRQSIRSVRQVSCLCQSAESGRTRSLVRHHRGCAASTTSASSLEDGEIATSIQANEEPVESDGREFERWLFTDWLEGRKSGSKAGRQKEPAIPILKSAKWNSGDNPVVVTSALMFLGVIVASLTERVGSMM